MVSINFWEYIFKGILNIKNYKLESSTFLISDYNVMSLYFPITDSDKLMNYTTLSYLLN